MYLQIDVPETDCTYEHTIIAKVSSYRMFREGKGRTWYFEDPCPLHLEYNLLRPSRMLLEKHEE